VAQQILANTGYQLLGGEQAPVQQDMRLPALRHTLARNGTIRQHIALDDHGP